MLFINACLMIFSLRRTSPNSITGFVAVGGNSLNFHISATKTINLSLAFPNSEIITTEDDIIRVCGNIPTYTLCRKLALEGEELIDCNDAVRSKRQMLYVNKKAINLLTDKQKLDVIKKKSMTGPVQACKKVLKDISEEENKLKENGLKESRLKLTALPQTCTHEYLKILIQVGELGLTGKYACYKKHTNQPLSVEADEPLKISKPHKVMLLSYYGHSSTLSYDGLDLLELKIPTIHLNSKVRKQPVWRLEPPSSSSYEILSNYNYQTTESKFPLLQSLRSDYFFFGECWKNHGINLKDGGGSLTGTSNP